MKKGMLGNSFVLAIQNLPRLIVDGARQALLKEDADEALPRCTENVTVLSEEPDVLGVRNEALSHLSKMFG
jgi:hypothetical protein